MAPEVLAKSKYSEKADVFSFGILLLELLGGRRPYTSEEFINLNQAQLMFQIIENKARPSLEGIDPSLQQLISDCWNLDPKLRPSFIESIERLKRLKKEKNRFSMSSVESTDEDIFLIGDSSSL